MMQEKEAFLLELDSDTFTFRVVQQAAFSEVRLADDDRMIQTLMMTRVVMYSVSKCNKARVEFLYDQGAHLWVCYTPSS
jgi:hypothetical protein